MVGIVVTDAYAFVDGVEYGRSLTRTDKLDASRNISTGSPHSNETAS